MNKYACIMILSAFMAAVSQLLLKKSANTVYKNKIFEYINIKVVTGYAVLLATMLINIYAYRGVYYKIGPVLSSFSYIFVLILSRIVFKEVLSKRKILGSVIILAGIIIYNL